MDMGDEHIERLLQECTLFKGMSYDEINHVLQGNLRRIKTYTKGSLIGQAGEKLRSMQILLQGTVKGEMVDIAGKVIKIEDITPPRPLAPAFLFGQQNRYPVNISAAENVKILSIPRDNFLRILQENEKVLVNFINILSNRGQFLSNKIKFLSFTSIKGKLARYLLDLMEQAASGQIVLPHSQVQLAELFGVARPSIGRALGELNLDGIIHTEGKHVEILDKGRLRAYLK